MDERVYGPLRLIGSLIAVAIYVVILIRLKAGLKAMRDDAVLMREFTMALLLFLTAIAFFIGALSLLNAEVTPVVRFVNTAILGGLIVGGIHVLATLRNGRQT